MAQQETLPTLTLQIALDGKDQGTREFRQELVTIGRGDAAVLKLDDDSLAELHAALQIGDDGVLSVLDLGAEATLLDGQPVNNAPVQDGAVLTLGKATITVRVAQPAPVEAPAAADAPPPADDEDVDEWHQVGEVEPVLDFVMRAGTSESDLSIDRKAPRILEVAQVWAGTVMNVQHFDRGVPAVYVGDRRQRQVRIASTVCSLALVLGLGFFMWRQASFPQPPRYPEGDQALMDQWTAEIAARREAEQAAKKAAREAELAAYAAEADRRINENAAKYQKEARTRLEAELKEDPNSTNDLAHFADEVRDEVIDEVEKEAEEAREKARLAALPPDPYQEYRDAWNAANDDTIAKLQKKDPDALIVKPNFDLFERPDWEDFVEGQMLPIAREMAKAGELRKSWLDEFKRISEAYDVYDDLDEKRVVEDLVLATRILVGGEVLTLVAGPEPDKVIARKADGSVVELANTDEVLLWAPSQAEMDRRKALFASLQDVLYVHAEQRHLRGLKCDALAELIKLDVNKNDFVKNAQRAECLADANKFDQAVEYYERAFENLPPNPAAPEFEDAYLAALGVRARILLRNAWRTEVTADGTERQDTAALMPADKRVAAEKAHEELRAFVKEHRKDPGTLKAVDNGIYVLAQQALKEKQQEQVAHALVLAAILLLLMPVAFGWDEIQSRKYPQDFFLDAGKLPNDHFAIVEQKSGSVQVNMPADAVGFLESADRKRISVGDLRASGRVKDMGGFASLDLGEEERFYSDLGGVGFFIHRVHRPKLLRAPFGQDIDWLFMGVSATMLLLAFALYVALAFGEYEPQQEQIVIPDRFVELQLQQVEKEKEKQKDPSGNPDAGEGAKAKGDEGKVGKQESKLKTAKGSKIAIQKSELDKRIAESTGLLADLNSLSDNSVFGTGGLDSSVSSALGGLIGSQYGDQAGSGGLGSRGSGFGGGGTAAGLGGLGTRGSGLGGSGYGRGGGFVGQKGGGAPGVGSGDPIVLGALDKSIIDRIVKQSLPQIRYCYEKELSKNPNLKGKLVIKFTISKDGSVAEASPKSSTLGNPIVENCVAQRFLRMRFPAPKGGGIVIVSYPFVFNSAG